MLFKVSYDFFAIFKNHQIQLKGVTFKSFSAEIT